MRGGGREWVVVDRDPTSNESFEPFETFVPPGPPTLDPGQYNIMYHEASMYISYALLCWR